MDRHLTQDEQSSGKFKNVVKAAVVIALLAGGYYAVSNLITKKGKRSELHIVKVEKGGMKATLSANGIVVPAAERVINAPVTTEIQKVLLETGAEVNEGDLILQLDQEYTALEYEQLQDQLSLRRNNISKLKLEFDKNLRDLDYQNQIKGLQLSELEAQLADQQRLLEIGGATAEEVEAADLQLKVARIEKKKLENELQYRHSVNDTEKANLQLEYDIQAKRLRELRRKLSETKVVAPERGVITWINEDIGKTVTVGEPLVKLANLNKYKVEATTSDRNSSSLSIGMQVEVRVGKERLRGQISRVLPEIVNNTVKFYVSLDAAGHSSLRPNLRTEIYIITSEKSDVLKAKRGTAVKGAKAQYFYKVENGKATKTRVTKGLLSSEYFEVESGLSEGDKIIISDVKEYEHMESFDITD